MGENESSMDSEQKKEIQSQEHRRKSIITDLAELPREALLNETAMAKAFGVCTRTIRRMVTRYELPPLIPVAGKSM